METDHLDLFIIPHTKNTMDNKGAVMASKRGDGYCSIVSAADHSYQCISTPRYIGRDSPFFFHASIQKRYGKIIILSFFVVLFFMMDNWLSRCYRGLNPGHPSCKWWPCRSWLNNFHNCDCAGWPNGLKESWPFTASSSLFMCKNYSLE